MTLWTVDCGMGKECTASRCTYELEAENMIEHIICFGEHLTPLNIQDNIVTAYGTAAHSTRSETSRQGERGSQLFRLT